MGTPRRQGVPRVRDPERCTPETPRDYREPRSQCRERGDPDPGRLGSQMSDVEEREYENS